MLSKLFLAAPKRRSSYKVKRMRAANHAIKNIEHSLCPVCGFAMHPHTVCRNCFEVFKLKVNNS